MKNLISLSGMLTIIFIRWFISENKKNLVEDNSLENFVISYIWYNCVKNTTWTMVIQIF